MHLHTAQFMNIWISNIYFLQLEGEDNSGIGEHLKEIFVEGILKPLLNEPTIGFFLLVSLFALAVACAEDEINIGPFNLEISSFGKRATPYISLASFVIASLLYINGVIPRDLDIQDNRIGRLYFNGSKEEQLGEVEKAQKYYERAIKVSVEKLNSDSTEDLESAMRYAEAKAAYRLGHILYKEKKYARSAENLLKAYTRYIEHQEYFDSPNEQVGSTEIDFLLLDHDFRFNHSRAYDSLFRVGKVRYDYANTFSLRRGRKKEELLKSINIYKQVLKEENTKNDTFRSLVWLSLSEAYSELNDDKEAILCLFRAYLVNQNDQEIIKRLEKKELLKESGELKLSEADRKEIYASSLFSASDHRNSIGDDGSDTLNVNEIEINEGRSGDEEILISSNPFTTTSFPRVSCGDDRPSDPSLYPIKMYRIYIDDTDENLRRVRGEFCNDAFVNKQVSKIQVASFHKRDLGHYFHILMEQEFGNAYTGAPRVYSSPNDTDPEILTN